MFGAILQIGGAFMKDRDAQKNARLLRAQGRVAQEQAQRDADAISREYRQIAGRQAAAIAQGGGGYEGSAAKLIHQSETLAFLDRLNTIYHGTMRNQAFRSEANAVKRRRRAERFSDAAQVAGGFF